jgi:hypothetical protein
MSVLNTISDEKMKHYSTVTKLVHYTSKFGSYEDERHAKQHAPGKTHRLSASLDLNDRFV